MEKRLKIARNSKPITAIKIKTIPYTIKTEDGEEYEAKATVTFHEDNTITTNLEFKTRGNPITAQLLHEPDHEPNNIEILHGLEELVEKNDYKF